MIENSDHGEFRSQTAIIILAAGASTRMGQPKQLFPFRGRTLLRHAAETALVTGCRPVVVVLGAVAARLEPELAGLPVTTVVNADWEQGMGSSIRTGINAICPVDRASAEDRPDSVIIMLCDQPLVTPAFLDQLTRLHAGSHDIVAAEYEGTAGVPALFGRAYFEELAGIGGSRGAKNIISNHATDLRRVPFPDAAVDIDGPADLARLEADGATGFS